MKILSLMVFFFFLKKSVGFRANFGEFPMGDTSGRFLGYQTSPIDEQKKKQREIRYSV